MKFEFKKGAETVFSKELNEGTYKIGRASDCEIVLDSTRVSKHHAMLVIRGNRAAILDTESSNGTFVNGILVKKQLLKSSDVIEIGEFKIRDSSYVKTKRNLEVFAQTGNIALESQVEEAIPDSEPLVDPISPVDSIETGNLGDKLLRFVDTKLLIPFYELVRITDYRFLTAVILVLSIGIASFFSITPILSWSNDVIKAESLKRGHTILKQLVRENYRVLNKSKDNSMLTTAAAEAEKDMIDVYVVDTKTKSVLAPVKYLSKSLNDPYVLIALEDVIEKKETEVTKDRGDGTYVLVQTIPFVPGNEQVSDPTVEAEDPETPSNVIIGYYKVPKSIIGVYEPLAVSGLISLLLALVAFFFIFKMISYPITQISEQLDSALKGEDIQVTCLAKMPELESLATVINFTVSKMKSSGGGLAQAPSGIAGGLDAETEETSFLKLVEEFCVGSTDGILVLDRDKKIKFVGPVLADLLSLRPQYAVGQNIGDACRDGSFAGTAIEITEKVISTLGENQTAQLEINGVQRNLTAVGHRYSNGDLGFIIITVKMNA